MIEDPAQMQNNLLASVSKAGQAGATSSIQPVAEGETKDLKTKTH